ncbi:MAG: NeuD/PglB/VioB family sugar acetyltransferase [Fusobacteriaceae bacterium]
MKSNWNGLPIVIIGKSGLGKKTKVTIDEINKESNNMIYDLVGFLDDDDSDNSKIKGINYLGNIEQLKQLVKIYPTLGVVVAIGFPRIKRLIVEKIKNIEGIVFPNIIHPKAFYYKEDLKIGYGNIIASSVNICTDVKIGDFNFINLSSTIGHDVEIKNFLVINPLASISGNVVIKDEVLIGTGANVLQNLIIEKGCKIGAGCVITKSCSEGKTYIGIPGRETK